MEYGPALKEDFSAERQTTMEVDESGVPLPFTAS
jgi:hypothetical protein